jgi:uncharacterized membrane protein
MNPVPHVPQAVALEQLVQLLAQTAVVHAPDVYKKYEALHDVQIGHETDPVKQNVMFDCKDVLQIPLAHML